VSESYSGRQFVGIDLHRRRSVIVRISNDVERLSTVMARLGWPAAVARSPEVIDRRASNAGRCRRTHSADGNGEEHLNHLQVVLGPVPDILGAHQQHRP
jgi:hypothetical protein